MSHENGITTEELSAFIDCELDPARAAEIEKLIASNSELASRVAAFRGDQERLLQIFGPLRDVPTPPKLVQLVEERSVAQQARRSPYSQRGIFALAASLLLAIGLGLGYLRYFNTQEDTIIAEAVSARSDAVHAEQTYAANTFSSPDSGDRIVASTLMMNLRAPDLSRMGYRLQNVSVYSGVPGGKAIELGYRDGQNRLFTLYLRHPSGPARVDLLQRDGMRLCVWQDEELGTVMLGEMSAGEMARLASLAYSGLTSS
jgi:anti-sigma factor RsiW